MAAKKTMTVDVEAMTSAIAKLIDDKIAAALQNAEKGAPVYSKGTEKPIEGKEAPIKAAPKQTAKTPDRVMLGDIEIVYDAVSARGNRYKGNVRGLIVDKRTGARVMIIGAKLFPSTSDEIPEGLSFIAEVK